MTSHDPAATPRGVYAARILANDRVCDEHYRLRMLAPGLGATAPGQFIQLQCRPLREQVMAHEVDWPAEGPPRFTQPELADKEPFLRRPISIAGRTETPQGPQLEIIYRTIGAGTKWLATAKPADSLSFMGPLGNAFPLKPEKKLAAVIGGGVGIPPMIYLATSLADAGVTPIAFFGVRAARLLPLTLIPGTDACTQGRPGPCVQELAKHCVSAAIASDDGSYGFHGLIGQAFANWLDNQGPDPQDLVAYCCGPEPLMKAIGQCCIARGIECYLALERHMACGVGTCQSCVCKIRSASPGGWDFKLCCKDGPVFDAREVVW